LLTERLECPDIAIIQVRAMGTQEEEVNNVSGATLGCCRMSSHRNHTKDATGSSHHAHPSYILITRHLFQQLLPDENPSFIQAKKFGSERRFFNVDE
jgi:hypothetical protein